MDRVWPESASGERWENQLYASKWIVRAIIDRKDAGDGLTDSEVEREVAELLKRIVARQNGRPHFFFTLGADVTLREWLFSEAQTDRLEQIESGEIRRFRLSEFMRNLLHFRESREGLAGMITQTIGVAEVWR